MPLLKWILSTTLGLAILPVSAEFATEVVTSQALTVVRNDGKPTKESGLHAMNAKENQFDRIILLRFDSEDLGEGVLTAGLQLHPLDVEPKTRLRFKVYGVSDGDKEDERFNEKDYDPAAKNTIIDSKGSTLLNRKQAKTLGTFVVDGGKQGVQFSSKALLSLIQEDTNGTITLAIARESIGDEGTAFAARDSKTPPTLQLILAKAPKAREAEPLAGPADAGGEEEGEKFAEAADPERYKKHLDDAVDLDNGEWIRSRVDGTFIYHAVGDTSKRYTGWLKRTAKEDVSPPPYDKNVSLWRVIDGISDGPYVQYYKAGEKLSSTQTIDGRRQGLFIRWDEDGNVIKKWIYKDGRPVRETIE